MIGTGVVEQRKESDCPRCAAPASPAAARLLSTASRIVEVLLSTINIAYYQALMAGMRQAIEEGRFEAFRRDFHARHVSNG